MKNPLSDHAVERYLRRFHGFDNRTARNSVHIMRDAVLADIDSPKLRYALAFKDKNARYVKYRGVIAVCVDGTVVTLMAPFKPKVSMRARDQAGL